jgi:hypothetical protein
MAILRALEHRNYRLFFFGQGISLIGSTATHAVFVELEDPDERSAGASS